MLSTALWINCTSWWLGVAAILSFVRNAMCCSNISSSEDISSHDNVDNVRESLPLRGLRVSSWELSSHMIQTQAVKKVRQTQKAPDFTSERSFLREKFKQEFKSKAHPISSAHRDYFISFVYMLWERWPRFELLSLMLYLQSSREQSHTPNLQTDLKFTKIQQKLHSKGLLLLFSLYLFFLFFQKNLVLHKVLILSNFLSKLMLRGNKTEKWELQS